MSYIEKEDVIAIINELPRAWNKHCGISKMEYLKIRINNLPDADIVTARHGKWIETTQPMGWDDATCAECSECGEDFVLDEWGMEDMKNLMLYCPNCGAKMDGDDGRED